MRADGRIAPVAPTQGAEFDPLLEVVVPFTTPELTQVALARADMLLNGLNGRISIILVQGVPLAFPMDRPPVAKQHLERMIQGLASTSRRNGEVRLARDVAEAWKGLGGHKVIVIASRRRPWCTAQERLAKLLGESGHEVVLVYPGEV